MADIEDIKFDYKGLSADDAKEIKTEVNQLKSSIKHYKSELKRPVFKFFSGENSHQIAKRLVKNYSKDLLAIAKSLGIGGLKAVPFIGTIASLGMAKKVGSGELTKEQKRTFSRKKQRIKTYARGSIVRKPKY
jgi:ribosomal protein L10|tara:strand:- start:68 stop:466 length:399 start_codon:yes stop_codon:yes gene_type:complete